MVNLECYSYNVHLSTIVKATDCGRSNVGIGFTAQQLNVSYEKLVECTYLIISTMMMITGSRMISSTSTTATAAIMMDPSPDTKTVLHCKTDF